MSRQSAINQLMFGAGVTTTLAAAGYLVLGVSYKNDFFPGYNATDVSSGTLAFYWLIPLLSTAAMIYVFYKIRQDVLAEQENREYGGAFYDLRSASLNSTDVDEASALVAKKTHYSEIFKKVSLVTLGSLTSLALMATFLLVVEHDAEKNQHFFNQTIHSELMGGMVGVIVLFVLTAGMLFCCSRRQEEDSTPRCWERFMLCGASSDSGEQSYEMDSTLHTDFSF